jgi:hypothetical protein
LAFVSFEQPSEQWEILDFMLARAYEHVQCLKCPVCGGWVWECSSEISKTQYVTYDIKDVRCRKTYALECHENSKLPDKERVKEPHRINRWWLWHKIDASIPDVYRNLSGGSAMPTIDDLLSTGSE